MSGQSEAGSCCIHGPGQAHVRAGCLASRSPHPPTIDRAPGRHEANQRSRAEISTVGPRVDGMEIPGYGGGLVPSAESSRKAMS
jgi:hypothetical protein